jgi:hypothetical protein
VVVAAVVAYAWWAVSLAPFSAEATAAVVAAGGVAAAAGWRWMRPLRHLGEPPTTLPWVVLLVAGAAWQLAAYLQAPRKAHPTISALANAAFDSHPTRAVAFLLWLAVAVHLARR